MAEDCQNGLDDDGDGLIDLNDVDDCICTGTDTIPFTSLIPNSSFESINDCPYDYAQLNFVEDWIQASEASSDYYNTCNFAGDGNLGLYGDPPQPLPNGNGYVGFANASSGIYKEYIGACLNGPMLRGSSYTLQLNLGFGANGRLRPFSPFEINIFGTNDCINLPFNGEGCPLGQADWFILGTTFVSGDDSWELVTYDFVPTVDIKAIVIGPGCTSHHESYYWLDNLQLNQTISFDGCPAFFSVKNNCGTIELQSEHVDLSCEVQWYYNGVAIAGATDRNYLIPETSEGEYQMMLTSQGVCNLSDTFIYTSTRVQFVGAIDTTFCEGESITVGTEMFSEEGSFQSSWSSEEGCDTLYNIEITLLPSNSQIIDTVLCIGQTITIDGIVYDESGVYNIPASRMNDCTMLDLRVQFEDAIPLSISETICTGQDFDIGGQTFVETGVFDVLIDGGMDCDIIVTLDLKVIDGFPDMSIVSEEEVAGDFSLSLSNIDFSTVTSIAWSGTGLIDCPSCEATSIRPVNGPNVYSVIVQDQNGCMSIDEISLNLEIVPGMYVPSGFTPNGDGVNDLFVIFGDATIRQIEEIQIVNRWGDIIYIEENIAPNDLTSGWDGNYKGEPQPAGVFLYSIRLTDIGGNILEVNGDVTLIR